MNKNFNFLLYPLPDNEGRINVAIQDDSLTYSKSDGRIV